MMKYAKAKRYPMTQTPRPCRACGVVMVVGRRVVCDRYCCESTPVPDGHPAWVTPVPESHPGRRDRCLGCGEDFLAVLRVRTNSTGGTRAVRRYTCSAPCRARLRAFGSRAKRLGVYVEHVDPGHIIERDSGMCGLCGERVDTTAKDPSDRGCLDHVIPLARGGTHERANVQFAHMRCNNRKSANVTPHRHHPPR